MVDKRLVKEKRTMNSDEQLSKKKPAKIVLILGTIHNLAHALSETQTREKINYGLRIRLLEGDRQIKELQVRDL